jgi:hypothetical protein
LLRGAALGGAAVILFERDEQKDKSGSADLAPWLENAQVKKKILLILQILIEFEPIE